MNKSYTFFKHFVNFSLICALIVWHIHPLSSGHPAQALTNTSEYVVDSTELNDIIITPSPSAVVATPSITPAPTIEPDVYALYIEYLGETLKESKVLTKEDFLVTAVYVNKITKTITDYEFISPTLIDTEGDTEISVAYKGVIAKCIVSYIKDNTKKYYNINFDSTGGSEVFPILSIKPGSTIKLPEAPTRYGYWFRGWYTDSSYSEEFDPNWRILQDYTLYALWMEKENPDTDTMSVYLTYDLFDSFYCKLTADLTGQNYGTHTAIDSEIVPNETVAVAAKNISQTQNYFAFHLDIMDCSFHPETPIPITISIPPEFQDGTTQVFYSPDEKQILGTCQGNQSGLFEYTFYAYHAGTYIVMSVPEIEPTPTPMSTTKPSISISLASQVKVNQEVPAVLKYKNFNEEVQSPEELTFKWSSSNNSIAKVSSSGIVSGIKAGTAVITVISENKKYVASATIKVIGKKITVSSIKLNKTKLSLKKGKTFQIKTTIAPKNASNKTLKYSSNNKKIATVSSKGKISAKKKGSCTITVKTTDGSNKKKTLKITVT